MSSPVPRLWIRSAEERGERRYENRNTTTCGDELACHRRGLCVSGLVHVTNGGSGGMDVRIIYRRSTSIGHIASERL